MATKSRTQPQIDRAKQKDKSGRYNRLNPCEVCGRSAGANYCSDARCNTLGPGLVLCEGCAAKLAEITDETEYLAAFPK